jgi:predicted Zn-dependent protease
VQPPPTLAELEALAARALEHADGEAQASALWERDGERETLTVELTCVIDGWAASATAGGTDDDALQRAARAAALHARRPRAWPTPGLPAPQEGRAHDGFDATLLRAPGLERSQTGAVDVEVRTGVARIAIASTTGLRAAEQRSHALALVAAGAKGRTIRLRAAAPARDALDVEALAREAEALLLEDRPARELPDEPLPVVLGHDAIAAILSALRPAFGVELDLGSGPLHGRTGTRVAAAAINLSDSPRYRSTLPRSFDAEGVPRRPVPLIQDGVAHRRVHDTASAARAGAESTGHASRAAAMAPIPEHLVLVGGGAAGVDELCAPVERGLYVPALSGGLEARDGGFVHTAHGAVLIERGERTHPLLDARLLVDPLAVLASVEALSARSRTLPLRGHAPGGPGAAVVPALRAGRGVSRA